MTRLTKQKAKLEELLSGVNAFNAKGKAAEIGAFWTSIFLLWSRCTRH